VAVAVAYQVVVKAMAMREVHPIPSNSLKPRKVRTIIFNLCVCLRMTSMCASSVPGSIASMIVVIKLYLHERKGDNH
jgi:hypothetical protein